MKYVLEWNGDMCWNEMKYVLDWNGDMYWTGMETCVGMK